MLIKNLMKLFQDVSPVAIFSFTSLVFSQNRGGSLGCAQIWYASPVSGALYFNLQVDRRTRREMWRSGGVLINSMLVTLEIQQFTKRNEWTAEPWKCFGKDLRLKKVVLDFINDNRHNLIPPRRTCYLHYVDNIAHKSIQKPSRQLPIWVLFHADSMTACSSHPSWNHNDHHQSPETSQMKFLFWKRKC